MTCPMNLNNLPRKAMFEKETLHATDERDQKVKGLSLSFSKSYLREEDCRHLLYFTISLIHSPHLSVSFVYFPSSSPSRLPPEITCRGIDKLSDHEDSQTLSLSLYFMLYQLAISLPLTVFVLPIMLVWECVFKCVLSN